MATVDLILGYLEGWSQGAVNKIREEATEEVEIVSHTPPPPNIFGKPAKQCDDDQ